MVSLPKNVTRIEEGRGTYMTASGEEKEAFAKLYLSLIARLHGSTAAEWGIAMHVLEATRFDGMPKRISIRQFMQVCRLSNRATQEGIARLVDRGLLYQEHEPQTQHLRYALIDNANPGIGPCQQEDGGIIVLLLGGMSYQVLPTVLQSSTVLNGCNCTTKEYSTVLQSSTPCTTKEYSTVLLCSTVPSRQPKQEVAPLDARESLESSLEKEERGGFSPPPPEASAGNGVISDSQNGQPERVSKTRKRRRPQGATLFSEDETQTLLTEASDVVRVLHSIRTWHEEEGDAPSSLDTLLRVRKFPVPYLLDEASAYKPYRPKGGVHTWAGFERWLTNSAAKDHLERYYQQQRARQNGHAQVKHPTTEEDRAANAASRADAERQRQQPRKLPNYLS